MWRLGSDDGSQEEVLTPLKAVTKHYLRFSRYLQMKYAATPIAICIRI